MKILWLLLLLHIDIIIIVIDIYQGFYAFSLCTSLTKVLLTNGLGLTGTAMFYMPNIATLLTTVTIPSTITYFGKTIIVSLVWQLYNILHYYSQILFFKGGYSFVDCTSLSQISFVNGLTGIGVNMFSMQGVPSVLTSLTIPSTILSIGNTVTEYSYWVYIYRISNSIFIIVINWIKIYELENCSHRISSLFVLYYHD